MKSAYSEYLKAITDLQSQWESLKVENEQLRASLKEIRDLHSDDEPVAFLDSTIMRDIADNALRAENERLFDQLKRTQGYEADMQGEMGLLRAENKWLRKQIETLNLNLQLRELDGSMDEHKVIEYAELWRKHCAHHNLHPDYDPLGRDWLEHYKTERCINYEPEE